MNLYEMAVNPGLGDDFMAQVEPFGQPLLDACKLGTVEQVEGILDQGVDINYTGFQPSTGLMLASERGHKPIVVLMLARGAEVDAFDLHEFTALHKASHNGHLDVVEVLYAAGADIEHMDDIIEYRALQHAAYGDHLAVCEFLLSKGADLLAGNADQTAISLYGASSNPRISAETKALRIAALEVQRRRDECWERRGPLLWVLAEHAYRLLQHRAMAIALAAVAHDPTEPIQPVALATSQQRHAFLLGRVFSNEGIVRLLVALL